MPYRDASPRPASELAYVFEDDNLMDESTGRVLKLAVPGAALGGWLALEGRVEVGLVVAGLGVAMGVLWGRAARDSRARLLRLTGNPPELEVLLKGKGAAVHRFPLSDLRDVRIDSATVAPPTGLTFGSPGFGQQRRTVGSHEVARLVFDLASSGPVFLSDAYSARGRIVEWRGNIRAFLRAGGWTPEDERPGSHDA